MPDKSTNPFQFWQELKRRKVIRVVAMYAASSFIILEAVDIIFPRMGLPDWTVTLVIFLLIIGFIFSLILSWVFDITPEGLKKTESAKVAKEKILLEPVKRRVRVSDIIIAVLVVIVVILAYPKIFSKDKFEDIRDPDGKISIAIMPFENLTGDSSLYFWQNGISEYLINGLGNSQELAVLSSRVISEVFESTGQISTASISPTIARETAKKIKAATYTTGNFIGSGSDFSIMFNLVNTENSELIWSIKVDGNLVADYRPLLDSLSDMVRNFLEIKALEENIEYDLANAYPNSAEAYKHYIDGLNSIVALDYESAIESLSKSIEIDSNFTFAYFYMAWAYCFSNQPEQAIAWTQKTFKLKNNLPSIYHPWINLWNACYITENRADIVKYLGMMEETGINSRFLWFDLGVTYSDFLLEYEKSIKAYEKVEELSQEWGEDWKYDRYYQEYCWVLLMADRPKDVNRIREKGLQVNPENGWLKVFQGSSYVMLGDTLAVEKSISEIRSIVKKYNGTESYEEYVIGRMYYEAKDTLIAEKHYRKAYNLDPENLDRMFDLAKVLVRSEINVEEGLALSQKMLEEMPDRSKFLHLKGLALHKLGRHEEALSILLEADEMSIGYLWNLKEDLQEVEKAIARQNSDK